MRNDLKNLRGSPDAPNPDPFTEARNARDDYRADLMLLVVPNGSNACGVANLPPRTGYDDVAWGVVARPCLSSLTFSHEVGHLLGAHHDPAALARDGQTAYPFPYSQGHYVTGVGRDIMTDVLSCTGCPPKQQFSSPLVNFEGTTTKSGTSTRDNRRAVSQVAPYVADYRSDPLGSFDLVRRELGGVRVSGWALDLDTVNPIEAHVYVDGVGTPLVANTYRPDVGAGYPGYGDYHGFNAFIPVTVNPGRPVRDVCVHAINDGRTPGANVLLQCRTIAVTGDAVGSADVIAPATGGARVAGWAIDLDTANPTQAHVYVDGVGAAVLTANLPRGDVAAAYPGYGPNHGFDAVVATAPGTHTVCVYAVNTVGSGSNATLRCQAVTRP